MRFALFAYITLCFGMDGVQAQKPSDWDAIRTLYQNGKVYAGLNRAQKKLSGKNAQRGYLVLRADGFNRIGEYAKAESDAREILPVTSGDTIKMAAFQLGVALMETGRPDSARFWLERSLGIAGEEDARLRLARLDMLKGDHVLAMAHLDRALEASPENVRALLERGAAYATMGDTAAARADLDKAVLLAPRDPVAWNSRGFHVHAAQGSHQEAIKDYDQAIKFDPNYSFAFNNRGWSLYKLGEVNKGRKNIELAARKRSNNPFVYRNLGVIALETGDTTKACEHFRRALQLNFEQLHGPEVSAMASEYCERNNSVDPAGPASKEPANATPPRSNAPKRSNAP